ncbi:hypothetical protein FOA52_015205 [Chlamydomonas sp. UWO 241]|nr:hypothetical protein FOA52_015205 [Chlamydomonas sp. UWO 241]
MSSRVSQHEALRHSATAAAAAERAHVLGVSEEEQEASEQVPVCLEADSQALDNRQMLDKSQILENSLTLDSQAGRLTETWSLDSQASDTTEARDTTCDADVERSQQQQQQQAQQKMHHIQAQQQRQQEQQRRMQQQQQVQRHEEGPPRWPWQHEHEAKAPPQQCTTQQHQHQQQYDALPPQHHHQQHAACVTPWRTPARAKLGSGFYSAEPASSVRAPPSSLLTFTPSLAVRRGRTPLACVSKCELLSPSSEDAPALQAHNDGARKAGESAQTPPHAHNNGVHRAGVVRPREEADEGQERPPRLRRQRQRAERTRPPPVATTDCAGAAADASNARPLGIVRTGAAAAACSGAGAVPVLGAGAAPAVDHSLGVAAAASASVSVVGWFYRCRGCAQLTAATTAVADLPDEAVAFCNVCALRLACLGAEARGACEAQMARIHVAWRASGC